MSSTVKVVFTKNVWNPFSWLIRWALPRSRFAWAQSSHCFIVYGDRWYQSCAPKGVSVINVSDVSKRDTIVKTIEYNVPDAVAGETFLVSQLGKGYDYKGAIGLAIAPTRAWNDDSDWFCYELAAACLEASGRSEFDKLQIITETALFALKP